MWKAYLNQYTVGLAILIVLGAIIAMQELRYKETLLTLQGTQNSLHSVSQELVEASSQVDSLSFQLKQKEHLATTSQQLTKDVAEQLRASREENRRLRDSISILKKENEDVALYLNTIVPIDIADRLRNN